MEYIFFNGKKFIIEQLDSIRTQSRNADEVLIFDDCSTDGTVEILNKYIANFGLHDWKVFVNAKNEGWRKNFMEGLWKASGELVFPCDQDDIWSEIKLEEMEKIMDLHPEINVLTSNYEAFYDSGRTFIGPERDDNEILKQEIEKNVLEVKYPGCTYCIRRRVVELSKKYWQPDFPHDALFWRIALFSDSLYSYNKSLIKWRKHDTSTYAIESFQSKNYEKKRASFDYALRVIVSLKSYITDQGIHDNKKKEILNTNYKWIEMRRLFYDSKKIIYWFKLIKYRKCYDRFRQFIGDFYLVYIKKGTI